MTEIVFRLANGTEHRVQAQGGDTVMSAALKNGVPGIIAECGGSCSCATCHCYLPGDRIDAFPAIENFEEEMLEGVASERLPASRLSCQLNITPDHAGIVIDIPATQL